MTSRIGFAWMLLILFGAGSLASQEAAQVQAQDKTWIEARIRAQETPQATPGSTEQPSLKPNPLETLRNFEPAADEVYRLGKGDEITVDFAGRPDLAAKLIVGPDGRIALPLAGDVMLDGLTRSQAARAIDSALSGYYSNLASQVTVTKYTSNKILLLGAVDKPDILTFDGTPTLLEALTRGGLETGANKSSQIPERCAIYRGRDQVVDRKSTRLNS